MMRPSERVQEVDRLRAQGMSVVSAAMEVGWRSRSAYNRTKMVFTNGIPRVQELVDEEIISIYTGYEIASLPPGKQIELLRTRTYAKITRTNQWKQSRRRSTRLSPSTQVAQIDELRTQGFTVYQSVVQVGWPNREKYYKAKRICDNGIPALRQLVDSGEISISSGSEIATLPWHEQERIVAKKVRMTDIVAIHYREKNRDFMKMFKLLNPAIRLISAAGSIEDAENVLRLVCAIHKSI